MQNENSLVVEKTFEERMIQAVADFLYDEELIQDDLWLSAERWKNEFAEELKRTGLLTSIDVASMEMGKLLFFNMLISQKDLIANGQFYSTETGRKENPAGVAFRAYSKQFQDWLKSHGANPMARFSKKLNIKDNNLNKPKHGNTKFINALQSVNKNKGD